MFGFPRLLCIVCGLLSVARCVLSVVCYVLLVACCFCRVVRSLLCCVSGYVLSAVC